MMGMNAIRLSTATPQASSTPTPVAGAPQAPTQADEFSPSLTFSAALGDTQIAPVSGSWEAARAGVADALLSQLKAWPSLHATIAVGQRADGSTGLLVASGTKELDQSEPEGIEGIISCLASSPAVKQAEAGSPAPFEAATAVKSSADASVYELRVPGRLDAAAVSAAIARGRQPNQRDMLAGFLEGLPKGQRAVVLLAGPSGAGKTSLIKDLQALAGDRKVVALTGDMYFRDVDDPEYPKTAQGTLDFDSPAAMHMDELASDVARLVRDGKADIPVYDFAASRPGGWRAPVSGVTGVRLDRKSHLELGADDILVIDSIHAANEQVVNPLQAAGLPHHTLYLDSQKAEDRLLRRIVRDFATREGSADRTLQFWDLSTFPGEVNYVRPTLLQMDPARDLYYVTRFDNDLGLSRDQIEHKVAELDAWGLAPTYDAFRTPDDGMAAFAQAERSRLEGVVASAATDAEKQAATRALERLDAAARHVHPPVTS